MYILKWRFTRELILDGVIIAVEFMFLVSFLLCLKTLFIRLWTLTRLLLKLLLLWNVANVLKSLSFAKFLCCKFPSLMLLILGAEWCDRRRIFKYFKRVTHDFDLSSDFSILYQSGTYLCHEIPPILIILSTSFQCKAKNKWCTIR